MGVNLHPGPEISLEYRLAKGYQFGFWYETSVIH